MAVTLFRKRKVINNIIIKNGVAQKEEVKANTNQEVRAKIRGKVYGRRTINRQN